MYCNCLCVWNKTSKQTNKKKTDNTQKPSGPGKRSSVVGLVIILWSSGQSFLELNLLPLRMTSFSGGKHTSSSGTVVKSRDSWKEEQDQNFTLIYH